MTKNTRKPICPACHGVGHWHATRLDPSEDCEVCNGAARVSKRVARRYKARQLRHRHVMRSNSWISAVYAAHDAIDF